MSSDSHLKCFVCGDSSRGVNFGLLTCMPCKSFFRKNVFKKPSLNCNFNNDCSITKLTRSFCAQCRLKKCLKLGMDPDLIRKVPQPNSSSKKCLVRQKSSTLPTPLSIGLLNNDRSLLSSDEWTVLSSFIRGYNEHDTCKNIEYYVNELSSLPPKLRMRTPTATNILLQYTAGIRPLIRHILKYHNSSLDVYRAVAKHNLYCTGAFNGLFICRQFRLFENPDFGDFCLTFCGLELTLEAVRAASRCEANGNLIKIMLMIFAFSSNCSILIYDETESLSTMTSSIDLIRIQNIYVTIFWKYLLYLYDYNEAIIRYSNIIKSFLDLIKILTPLSNNRNNLITETVRAELERTLVIQD